MKKIVQSLSVLAASLSLFSCNDKLNIAAPYKNITVVYGLLDMGDTAHYIRIQKAFMDENQSAIDMAKVADSSFYNALSVSIKELGPGGVLISTIPLTKVDLASEGYVKDSGAFFNTPNYAYKFKNLLNPSYQYRLIVLNTNTGNVDSAITPIIDNTLPNSSFGLSDWERPFETIDFSRVVLAGGKPAEGTYSINYPATVGAVELVLRFNWTDSNIVTGTAERKYADFKNFKPEKDNLANSKLVNVTYVNSDIYQFLKESLGAAVPNQYRYFDSCDMILYAAGFEYKRYKDLNSNKGGLTADEIKPAYTNIKGSNVMGLLSTRGTTRKLQMGIGSDTRDSLLTNNATRGLNIRFYK